MEKNNEDQSSFDGFEIKKAASNHSLNAFSENDDLTSSRVPIFTDVQRAFGHGSIENIIVDHRGVMVEGTSTFAAKALTVRDHLHLAEEHAKSDDKDAQQRTFAEIQTAEDDGRISNIHVTGTLVRQASAQEKSSSNDINATEQEKNNQNNKSSVYTNSRSTKINDSLYIRISSKKNKVSSLDESKNFMESFSLLHPEEAFIDSEIVEAVNSIVMDITPTTASNSKFFAEIQEYIEKFSQPRVASQKDWSNAKYLSTQYILERKEHRSKFEFYRSQKNISFPIVLTGLSGMGKSSLAVKWSKELHNNPYERTRWMSMDKASMELSLENLANDFDVDINGIERNVWLENLSKLLKKESWFIVWDDVEHPDDIADVLMYFFPAEGFHQHLLITSCYPMWDYPISVKEYSEDEAIEYVKNKMRDAIVSGYDLPTKESIVEDCGRHPFALELMLVDIYEKNTNTEDRADSILPEKGREYRFFPRLNSKKSLDELFRSQLEKLQKTKNTSSKQYENSLDLLRLLSFLVISGISEKFFENYFGDMGYKSGLNQLMAPGLIKESADRKLFIHKLFHVFILEFTLQDWKENPTRAKVFLKKMQVALKETFFQDKDYDNSEIREGVIHGNYWIDNIDCLLKDVDFQEDNFLEQWTAQVYILVIPGERMLGNYARAEMLLHRAMSYYKKEVAIPLENIMEIKLEVVLNKIRQFWHDGFVKNVDNTTFEYAEALGQLAVFHYYHTEDCAFVAKCLNQSIYLLYEATNYFTRHSVKLIGKVMCWLGNNHYKDDDFDKARNAYEHALEVYKMIDYKIGLSDIESNLGELLFGEGKYAEALARLLKVEAMENNTFSLAMTHGVIGQVYCAMKDYFNSYRYLRKAWDVFKTIDSQECMANMLNNCGELFCAMGRDLNMSSYLRSLKFDDADLLQEFSSLCKGDVMSLAFTCLTESLKIKNIIYVDNKTHVSIAITLKNLGVWHETIDRVISKKYYMDARNIYVVHTDLNNQNKIREIDEKIQCLDMLECDTDNAANTLDEDMKSSTELDSVELVYSSGNSNTLFDNGNNFSTENSRPKIAGNTQITSPQERGCCLIL